MYYESIIGVIDVKVSEHLYSMLEGNNLFLLFTININTGVT